MPSIKVAAIQKQFADLGDQDTGISLTGVEQILAEITAQFVIDANNNLNVVDRVASGSLSDSIIALPIKVLGKVVTAQISVNSYYKFVDQGVGGVGKGGVFSFKTLDPSRSMVAAIRQWMMREGIKITDRSKNKVAIVPRESRRIGNQNSDAGAYIIARSIKKKGLKKTNFWTDAENTLREKIKTDLQKGLKIDIINGFK